MDEIQDSSAIPAAFDIIAMRQYAAGDFQMALAANAVAHNSHRPFPAVNPSVKEAQEGFGHFVAKQLQSLLALAVGCRSMQFKFLQNQQVFNEIIHN